MDERILHPNLFAAISIPNYGSTGDHHLSGNYLLSTHAAVFIMPAVSWKERKKENKCKGGRKKI